MRNRYKLGLTIMFFLVWPLACTNGNLCNQDYPCRAGDSCVSGVCQRGPGGSKAPPQRTTPQAPTKTTCDPGIERSAWNYECSSNQECSCIHDAKEPACLDTSSIELNTCYHFTDHRTKKRHGFCSITCSLDQTFKCSCPRLFGRYMSCHAYVGEVSESSPKCWPGGGMDTAKTWPHPCETDADCVGKYAAK